MRHLFVGLAILATATVALAHSPYTGTPFVIATGPAGTSTTVDAWKFDLGGNNDAYYEWSSDYTGRSSQSTRRIADAPSVDVWDWGPGAGDVICTERNGSIYGADEWLIYSVSCASWTYYNFYMTARHDQAQPLSDRDNAIQLYVDDAYQGVVSVQRLPNEYNSNGPISRVLLTQGNHEVKIKFTNDGFFFMGWTASVMPEPATALLLLGVMPLLRRRRLQG